MHKAPIKSERCPITESLDKRRSFQGVLYTVLGDALQLEVANLAMLDKCVGCQYGMKRELSISEGITKIKCLKWGSFPEI
mgnify:CR=1 FL=1